MESRIKEGIFGYFKQSANLKKKRDSFLDEGAFTLKSVYFLSHMKKNKALADRCRQVPTGFSILMPRGERLVRTTLKTLSAPVGIAKSVGILRLPKKPPFVFEMVAFVVGLLWV